jgi:hypothetical protein
MLPSWQLHYPNKSLQAYFLPEIDVVSQNCKTQNNSLTLRVIPRQLQQLTLPAYTQRLISALYAFDFL